ncbi:class A beta-lactamase, subclass A2 [Flagellimonas meridianipacifica]|uniref:beta-lactamase n=1 Tax=Flagellimonas meridianipacifica TaxID=1080225 RepID=A0A2T0MBA4_9FLAO|nr:class A beta-lactamase, subclass A2 [Allomuricauda pacifica]PRX54781.1 beta-lactamase class A/beta-lactamase class A VEB [Allomuricauda pacifica]
MKKQILIILLVFTATLGWGQVNSIDRLKQEIEQVVEGKLATVAVSIQGMEPQETLSVNGNLHLPMQSVFKLHLAAAVLNEIDKGKLGINDSIKLTPELILEYKNLWSPLRKKYPKGGKVQIEELLKYNVAWSDNVGCDVLLDLIGGPIAVQNYIHGLGVKDIAIIDKEIFLQSDWSRQYLNWSTTNASNSLLQILYENQNILSASSHQFLMATLKETSTGKGKIRGQLPKDAVVAHKTGSSGKNKDGLTGATNDIGIVFLPDNRYFYISIFVSDSKEDEVTNQKMMADITKLAWDYFQTKK